MVRNIRVTGISLERENLIIIYYIKCIPIFLHGTDNIMQSASSYYYSVNRNHMGMSDDFQRSWVDEAAFIN